MQLIIIQNDQVVMTHFGWKQAINRARQSVTPITVNKNNVGSIPWGFETKLDFGNLYRSYKRQQGAETIVIREFPTHYAVDVRYDEQQVVGQPGLVEPRRNQGLINQSGINQDDQSAAAGAALLAVAGGASLAWALKRLFDEPKPKKTYKLFISHSWDYEDDFERLKNRLDDVDGFEFLDYSVPQDDPLDAQSNAELRRQLRSKIKQTSAVVIISGMYASYSDWIEAEINIANDLDKPIIGVKPWGNERMPRKVKEEARVIVGWNTQSIVDAVQEHA